LKSPDSNPFFDFCWKLASNCVLWVLVCSITPRNFKKQVVGFFKKWAPEKSNFRHPDLKK